MSARSWLLAATRIRSLVLSSAETVVGAPTSFALLPFSSLEADHHPDVANLAESVAHLPFEGQTLLLQAGVHLHWQLPTALLRGRETLNGLQFPKVPDRWLVRRSSQHNAGAKRSWIVDSSYLTPAGVTASGESVAIPFESTHHSQPYRFLGRRIDEAGWESAFVFSESQEERLSPFTAVGHGDPSFHASYARSRSVFGMHDELDGIGDSRELHYELLGWYSNESDDVLLNLIEQLSDVEDLNQSEPLSGTTPRYMRVLDACHEQLAMEVVVRVDRTAVLREDLPEALWQVLVDRGWIRDADAASGRIGLASARQSPSLGEFNHLRSAVDARLEELAREKVPKRWLCHGTIDVELSANNKQNSAPSPPQVSVALGNTGTEALAAHLAGEIEPSFKSIAEDQLEAMLLDPHLSGDSSDVGTEFLEARHERQFVATPGGTIWTLRFESQDKEAHSHDAPLPSEFAQAIHTANLIQAEFDRQLRYSESRRAQLFADWSKYMVAAYPPEASRDTYPDPDELRHFVDRELRKFESDQTRTGRLELGRDSSGALRGVKLTSGASGSIAERLAAALTQLIDLLEEFNQNASSNEASWVLRESPNECFWEPQEPVVMLSSDAALVSAKDTRALTENFTLFSDMDPRSELTPRRAVKLLDATHLPTSSPSDAPFASPKSSRPWTPWMLEWEVEFFPTAKRGNHVDHAYHRDYVGSSYEIGGSGRDLRLRSDAGTTAKGANTYVGSSLLTPGSSLALESALDTFVRKRIDSGAVLLPSGRSTPALNGPALSAVEIAAIRADYEAHRLSPESSPADRAKDATWTAIRGLSDLRSDNHVAQSLSGINSALLMHRQTYQLALGDPLGFEADRDLAQKVQTAVGSWNRVAPLPLSGFNPIRAGELRLLRLRLVDTFGQTHNLDPRGHDTSETLASESGVHPVALAPRLAQAARLSFRWLGAQSDAPSNSHPETSPVCGWLVPNNLDGSIAAFDFGGRALGAIETGSNPRVPERARWSPAPGGLGAERISQVANPHLRRVMEEIVEQGPGYVETFLVTLDSALDNIDPATAAQHVSMSLLVGRPLAVVRASLEIELAGLPAIDQSWSALTSDLQRTSRESHRFHAVQWPVRIGEHAKFGDGLAGYWIDSSEGFEDHRFRAVQSDSVSPVSEYICNSCHDQELPRVAPLDRPLTLYMLVDPRAAVHATSGCLPTRALALDPCHYATALEAIEVSFRIAPLLTPNNRMRMPLPPSGDLEWSWLQRSRADWDVTTSAGSFRFAQLEKAFPTRAGELWQDLQQRGWIAVHAETARVVAPDKRVQPSLSSALQEFEVRVAAFFQSVRLEDLDSLIARFDEPKIREGWLRLTHPNTLTHPLNDEATPDQNE